MKASILEIIFLTVTLLSYLLILSTPFLLSRYIKTNNFFKLLLVSVVFTFIFSTLSTYWSEDLSDKLIYKIYGFDDYGMSEEERFGKVSLENRQTIQEIYNGSFGIGWPLKLIMIYVILLIPYNFVSCGLVYLFKHKNTAANSSLVSLLSRAVQCSADSFVVKIATFTKPENVLCNKQSTLNKNEKHSTN